MSIKKKKKFVRKIVKVQISLFTSEKHPQVLVYTKNHDHMYQGDVKKDILKAMGNEPKKFFYANVPMQPGFIQILEEAPWQDW